MGMFYNGANCDLYIGKGAGKKLMQDVYNAQKSIKIISPYLSPSLIKELINLSSRGIDIQLITVDHINDYDEDYDQNIYKLIKQHVEVNEKAQVNRNKWIKYSKIFLLCIIIFSISIVYMGFYLESIKVILGVIPILFFVLVHYLLKQKIKNKRIFNYTYSQLFPFKVYMSPYKNTQSDTFIHGKIYLIDDSIAYMGSLNFTTHGTKDNYETRIRTTDNEAIKEIKREFFDLFHNSNIPERCIQSWGKFLYKEPIN